MIGDFMTIGLGQRRVLKEARVEIKENGEITGFLDLVSKTKRIFLEGKIDYFNDDLLEERKKKQKFPIIIHFKIHNPLKDGENIKGISKEPIPVEEYLEQFDGDQKIGKRMSIWTTNSFLHTETSSQPFNDLWHFGAALHEMEILEAKNVPGLKDVKKK